MTDWTIAWVRKQYSVSIPGILADIPSWLYNIQYSQEVTHLLLKIQHIVGTEVGWITHSNWRVWLRLKQLGIKQRVQHVVGLVTITIIHSAIVRQGWDWLLVLLDNFSECLGVIWVHLTQWSIATLRFSQALLNSWFLFFKEQTIDLWKISSWVVVKILLKTQKKMTSINGLKVNTKIIKTCRTT